MSKRCARCGTRALVWDAYERVVVCAACGHESEDVAPTTPLTPTQRVRARCAALGVPQPAHVWDSTRLSAAFWPLAGGRWIAVMCVASRSWRVVTPSATRSFDTLDAALLALRVKLPGAEVQER